MWVDKEIVQTYLIAGLDEELARMAAIYIERYPGDDSTAIFRGMQLAYSGKIDEGRAVMDSTLAAWRAGEEYEKYPQARHSIDAAAFQFAALLDGVEEDYEKAATNWSQAITIMDGHRSFHEQWYPRYRWASALHSSGQSAKSLEILAPILQINPRLISLLVLKVECHLALRQGDQARQALDQLQWSLTKSDPDFPQRIRAEELALQVSALAVGD